MTKTASFDKSSPEEQEIVDADPEEVKVTK